MSDPLLWHRLQFAFTIVFHYLFPQLTMGLALLIVLMKAIGLRTGDRRWDDAARFWIRIFGINFAVGVVTGIPMEFQFGTNWANFSRYAGGVVGQTLAMEGLFAFFLESTFLGLLVFGERRLGPSRALPGGPRALRRQLALRLLHHLHQRLHAASGGPRRRRRRHAAARRFLGVSAEPVGRSRSTPTRWRPAWSRPPSWWRPWAPTTRSRASIPIRPRGSSGWGSPPGLVSSVLVAFPTGDQQAKLVARHQPVALAAMEGHFESERGAGIVVIGQPNVQERRLDNPIVIPGFLSFLAYGTFHSNVKGLNEFSEDLWPDNIELLYYSFHIMAGLGTLFILSWASRRSSSVRGTLARSRPMLWTLMLAFPFPYIATTTGWMTAELGRQPWLVYGLMRTADGASPRVHSGTALFTLIGFTGLYLVLGVLFLFLVGRELAHGPDPLEADAPEPLAPAAGRGVPWLSSGSPSPPRCSPPTSCSTASTSGPAPSTCSSRGTTAERRQVLAAIGPFWDGNEVWLLATGGALFVAFPRVLASGLSGFYFAIFLVLWVPDPPGSLDRVPQPRRPPAVAGGLGCRLRRRQHDAAGAVRRGAREPRARGCPSTREGWFSLPLFTDFTARAPVGILDWYTVFAGVFALTALAGHGATFLPWKSDGLVHERSRRAAGRLYAGVAVLWPAR